jgi:hypothetical protein
MYIKLREVEVLNYFQDHLHKIKITYSYRCLSATVDIMKYLYEKCLQFKYFLAISIENVFCLHICTYLKQSAIIVSFVRELPENGHVEAETCGR